LIELISAFFSIFAPLFAETIYQLIEWNLVLIVSHHIDLLI